jgi:E3 ubiquitin-protein ligase EDD1
VKNNSDMLDTLLNTLIRQIKLQPEVAKVVAKRFVRSVIRVFVVFNIELPPGQAKKTVFITPSSPPTRYNNSTHDKM